MLKRNQFFVALNLGLFAIIGLLYKEGTLLINIAPQFLPILCGLGATISLFWTFMTWRARYYIKDRRERLEEIEKLVGYDILHRTKRENTPMVGKLETWILFLVLGYLFVTLWIILLLLLRNQSIGC